MTWTTVPLLKTTSAFLAAKGVPNARLDAEVLLCHALGLENRVELYTGFERPLSAAELDAYRELVRRRARREPVSHILGYRDFLTHRFLVTRDVLAPRPETEILVEQAAKLLREAAVAAPAILDLGTGSGCIGLSLAAMFPTARVVATDISAAALEVARENARRLGVAQRVELRRGDLFAGCRPGEAFDLVASNPPYVSEDDPEVWPEVREFEPAVAVFAPRGATSLHQRIASEVETWLNPGSWLLLELGAGQAREVAGCLRSATLLEEIRLIPDHAGIERVLAARRPER